MSNQRLSVLLLISLLFFACKKSNIVTQSIAPFSIVDDTTIAINDVINGNSLRAFNEAIRQNPKTKLLVFKEAPGSEDDEVNVQLGRKLHEVALNTHVENNGFIASGAVDLFLAGISRTLGENTRVGVHSWSDGNKEATDFPRSAPEHQLFIRYYTDIGLSQQLAEDFYFFTIDAAPARDVYLMTPEEIEQYLIVTK
ncbi:MAG: hypothetical protein ABJG47_09570 [Ekhidna sp.]